MELKPCPFCGRSVAIKQSPLWHGSHGYHGCYEYSIGCENCGCTIDYTKNDTIYYDDETCRESVTKAWNRRANDG